jgi:hypothetical protein
MIVRDDVAPRPGAAPYVLSGLLPLDAAVLLVIAAMGAAVLAIYLHGARRPSPSRVLRPA